VKHWAARAQLVFRESGAPRAPYRLGSLQGDRPSADEGRCREGLRLSARCASAMDRALTYERKSSNVNSYTPSKFLPSATVNLLAARVGPSWMLTRCARNKPISAFDGELSCRLACLDHLESVRAAFCCWSNTKYLTCISPPWSRAS